MNPIVPALQRWAAAFGAVTIWAAAATGVGAQQPAARTPYALVPFVGRMTDQGFFELVGVQEFEWRDAYLAGVGLSRRVGGLLRSVEIEVEGQVVRHVRGQNHWEFNGAVVGRWTRFPWNARLPTSLAYGAGPSYATEVPEEEVARLGTSRRLLVYTLTELEIGLPGRRWSAVARIHHRSGAFGALADRGGSNWITLGIRRRF